MNKQHESNMVFVKTFWCIAAIISLMAIAFAAFVGDIP